MDTVSLNHSSMHEGTPGAVKSFACAVSGKHTEFLLTYFPNAQNIIITQFGKIGNLYQVKFEQPENGVCNLDPIYTITTLLGGDNIEAEVAVRYLVEKLNLCKPSLVCLSLKEVRRESLDAIISAIKNFTKR